MTNQSLPTYWDKIKTSKHLCCSIRTVDRLIKKGRIKAFKLGRKVLIYPNTCVEENINSVKPIFNNLNSK